MSKTPQERYDEIQKDIIEIYGDYEDEELSISMKVTIMTVNFKTSTSISASMGYMDVIVKSGSNLSLSMSDYVFMPGTKIVIEEGATVNVGANVDVAMLGVADVSSFTSAAGFGNSARFIDKVDSYILVNGTLNVTGNIGGIINTSAPGAMLTLSGGTSADYTMLIDTVEGASHIITKDSTTDAYNPKKL